MPAGRLPTTAVVPTTVPDAFTHEYFIVPVAPLIGPAITDPVGPHAASVLVDGPSVSVEAVVAIVTVLL